MEVYRDYRGRSVRLTFERRAHILEHPEMESLEARIAEVLLNPERVIQSRTDPQVHLYYGFEPETLLGSKWFCVVVKSVREDAFILTAYLTDKPKLGVLVWPGR
jgi:hypothetical protein